MTGHDRAAGLLALAAAGALDAEEERFLRTHTAACPQCRAELEVYQTLAAALTALPTPNAPASLVEQTRRRVAAAMGEESSRRSEERLLALLALFGWTVSLSVWAVWRTLTGLTDSFVPFLAATTVLAWLTAGAVIVLVGRRRPAWRD